MGTYQKLVRDLIPDIIRSNNEEPVTRKLAEEEYKEALLDKLMEEAEEVTEADSREELRKEIGDVREVLFAIIDAFDMDEEKIEKLRKKRKEGRGGFSDGIFLEDVDGS